jgi:hypothetical protein
LPRPRSGVDDAEGRHRSGDGDDNDSLRNLLAPVWIALDIVEGGAQRSLSSRRGSHSSCRVALPPAKQEVVASHASPHGVPIEDCCVSTVCQALPSPEVMPHETSLFARHHPLALHCVPRLRLSTRNLLRNLLALAWMTPEVATAVATATTLSARNLLRNLLAVAWMTPKVAAAAATAQITSRRPSP